MTTKKYSDGQTEASPSLQSFQTNSIGMEFVLIPAGTFMMGSDDCSLGCNGENPRHKVTISKSFALAKYVVTQSQWQKVMGNNPSSHKGDNLPVIDISWYDAQAFIRTLNELENTASYRLPTEAEWEYAARAGSEGEFCFGDDDMELGQYAWYWENSCRKMEPSPVGQKRPNAWGLYDMHGNVWEWVQDWYNETYYTKSPSIDPQGPSEGLSRVRRGGCFYFAEYVCRSAHRCCVQPDRRVLDFAHVDINGFRVLRSLEP